jgi:hypothetical protein
MTRPTWVTLLATTLLGLLAMVAFPRATVNPGPLTAAHRGGRDHCLSCHAPGRGTPEEKCLACHPLIGIGLQSANGGPLPAPSWRSNLIHNVQPGTCMDCHFEHYLKGRPEMNKNFPHGLLPAPLLESCGACHAAEQPRDRIHVFAPTTCTPCHTPTRWKPATFDHSRFVPDRAHNVACAICHTVTTGFTSYTCYGCHAHTPAGMVATHLKEKIVDLRTCVPCHSRL